MSPWQWSLLALGAFTTGLSKTGIAGLGVLSVALFANALPARASTGALLPLLLCADVFGVTFYRKHADWSHIWKLFPWVLIGIAGGFFALGHLSDGPMQRLLGAILLAMVGLHLWRRQQFGEKPPPVPQTWWLAGLAGVLAGFTTMVANAAGPIMILYLLAIGLPKMSFIGTSAWFFMLVNALKAPFSIQLGLITWNSLLMDAILVIPMIPGALLGPPLLRRMNQKMFESMVLVLTVIAAVRLLF